MPQCNGKVAERAVIEEVVVPDTVMKHSTTIFNSVARAELEKGLCFPKLYDREATVRLNNRLTISVHTSFHMALVMMGYETLRLASTQLLQITRKLLRAHSAATQGPENSCPNTQEVDSGACTEAVAMHIIPSKRHTPTGAMRTRLTQMSNFPG